MIGPLPAGFPARRARFTFTSTIEYRVSILRSTGRLFQLDQINWRLIHGEFGEGTHRPVRVRELESS